MTKTKYSKQVEEAYDRIIDAISSVEFKGITILTGSNGSGKSLIRKQLPFVLQRELNLDDVNETSGMIKSTSMDARTGSNPEWGALSGMMRDVDWIATSQNTLHSLKGLLNSVGEQTRYLIIDEFEIGCGEETVMALSDLINKKLKNLIKNNKIDGAMIVTHSRVGVANLYHDHFINMEGMTEDEWLNREVKPINLKQLEDNELFRYIKYKEHQV